MNENKSQFEREKEFTAKLEKYVQPIIVAGMAVTSFALFVLIIVAICWLVEKIIHAL